MRTGTILILAFGMAVGFLTACSGGGSGDGADGRLTVLTSFYPLENVARAVGGPGVSVEDLTPPGVEPHDLELDSDQLDRILDADVVLYLGGGFQPAVEDAVAQRGDDQVTVDVLEELGPAVREAAPGVAEGDETTDPHVWLDPVLMEKVADVVADALDEADPGEAHGAAEYQRSLTGLDRDYRDGLAGCRSRLIVTTHAAFGYLAARYGLEQEPITGISPEGEPDPARLADIEDLVRREHVTTIFTEPFVSSDVADTVARETGTKVHVLNPIESLTSEERDAGLDYASVMRTNLEALRGALGCT
jgi:zinc transport system substrate-binding protein